MRWTCDSRPHTTKRGMFSLQEKNKIQLQALLGNRWPDRTSGTGNKIKNQLKKRLTKISPNLVTNKPYTNNGGSIRSKSAVNLSHMAQ
ncbi:uncharacterized protein LOC111386637 [Olea europaea var. sylvestris]|nr:uncharacterized protein LOC111386637 [Olea europaea var. sylvestris]